MPPLRDTWAVLMACASESDCCKDVTCGATGTAAEGGLRRSLRHTYVTDAPHCDMLHTHLLLERGLT